MKLAADTTMLVLDGPHRGELVYLEGLFSHLTGMTWLEASVMGFAAAQHYGQRMIDTALDDQVWAVHMLASPSLTLLVHASELGG